MDKKGELKKLFPKLNDKEINLLILIMIENFNNGVFYAIERMNKK